eukprot:1715857-Pyramimonas_sp.AAC.1
MPDESGQSHLSGHPTTQFPRILQNFSRMGFAGIQDIWLVWKILENSGKFWKILENPGKSRRILETFGLEYRGSIRRELRL